PGWWRPWRRPASLETCSRMDSGRSLRRRRPTVTERSRSLAWVVASIVMGIAACFGVADFAAAQPTNVSGTPDGNALLDRFLDAVETLQAHFEQELWTAD